MTGKIIYKLLQRGEWEAAQAMSIYRGSAHDLRDGFIHFSTAAQLGETARKYFSGVPDLVLLAIEVEALSGNSLHWEPSRGGDLFPHLYADLPIQAVTSVVSIPLAGNGAPILPSDLTA